MCFICLLLLGGLVLPSNCLLQPSLITHSPKTVPKLVTKLSDFILIPNICAHKSCQMSVTKLNQKWGEIAIRYPYYLMSSQKTFLRSILGQVCLHVKDQTVPVNQHGDFIVHLFQVIHFSLSAPPHCWIC